MALALQAVICVASVSVVLASGAGDWEKGVNEEGRTVQTLKIQAPALTEEDQYGYNMPDQYRCDSCKAVVYHLGEALLQKELKSRRLKEWEVEELFDDTCKNGFAGYGLSHVNGESVLSGPAFKRDNLEPGMGAIKMGGETWEKRLGEICRKFVYDRVGEDELYEHFRKHRTVSQALCFHQTRDCKHSKFGPELPQDDVVPESQRMKKKQSKAKGNPPQKIELSNFMAAIAVKQGLAKADYTRKRSFQEWEQLVLDVADRISQERTKATSNAVEV